MKISNEKRAGKKVRVKSVGDWPLLSKIIVSHYEGVTKELGTKSVCFDVPMLPKSLNHYKTLRVIRGKPIYILHNDVNALRQLVMIEMRTKNIEWKPTGITAAVVLFCDPVWVTKDRTVRKMDVDNRPKTMFDAIEHITGAPDELHWNVHAFKVFSKQTRTRVYLFDIGDIVEQLEDES